MLDNFKTSLFTMRNAVLSPANNISRNFSRPQTYILQSWINTCRYLHICKYMKYLHSLWKAKNVRTKFIIKCINLTASQGYFNGTCHWLADMWDFHLWFMFSKFYTWKLYNLHKKPTKLKRKQTYLDIYEKVC